MKLIFLLVILFALLCWSSRNWRRSLYVVFVLLVLEGALRKWVLPQASELVYFLKDFILFGAYFKYFFLSKNELRVPVRNDFVKIFFMLSAVWCFFQSFNPSLGSIIVGLFGLRGYLFYVPLMWMATNLFRSEDELYRFIRMHLLLLIPVGILGMAQFVSPSSSPLNVYASGEASTAGFVGLENTRITGTFSYIAGYAVFLIVCFSMLMPVLLRKQSHLWQGLAVIELVLLIANSFMTGSRSVVFANTIFIVGYISLSFLTQASLIVNYIKKFAILAIVSFLAASVWFRSAFDAFAARATSSDSLLERIADGFAVSQFFVYKQLDGYGTGATHQAVNVIRNVLGLPHGELIPVGFESEMGRVALELGPFGFVFWYGLRISLIFSLGYVFFKLRDPFLRQLALSAFLVHLIQISGQLVVNHTFLVYYWFLASFIFLLPHLERVKDYQKHQQFVNFNVSTFDLPYSSKR